MYFDKTGLTLLLIAGSWYLIKDKQIDVANLAEFPIVTKKFKPGFYHSVQFNPTIKLETAKTIQIIVCITTYLV